MLGMHEFVNVLREQRLTPIHSVYLLPTVLTKLFKSFLSTLFLSSNENDALALTIVSRLDNIMERQDHIVIVSAFRQSFR